jgi:hypothetical protein
MKQLLRGATGFGLPADAMPASDLHALAGICYHAARRVEGTVISFVRAAYPANFHTCTIRRVDRTVMVVLHCQLPLLAFADPLRPGEVELNFLDEPKLAAAIAEVSDLQILSEAELRQPADEADLSQLEATETQQINHWKPGTIGEIVFNFWD